MIRIFTGTFILLFAACSGSGNTSDARDGVDAADGADGEQVGDDGGSGADWDTEDSFGLLIPTGARACTFSHQSGAFASDVDVFWEYALQGRVAFREGLVRLPRDKGNFEAELIEKVELGPDRAETVPIGPGDFTLSIDGTEDNGVYRYEYSQLFDLKGEPFEMNLWVTFEVQNGVATEPLFVLDERTLTEKTWPGLSVELGLFGYLGDGTDRRKQYYKACGYELYDHYTHDIEIENGDSLQMEQRMYIPPNGIIPKFAASAVTRAEFTRGGETREVTGHFRLAYAAAHHNWFEQYLVVFDQPVGTVYGLLLREENTWENPGEPATEINYLDTNLNVVDLAQITSYEIQR